MTPEERTADFANVRPAPNRADAPDHAFERGLDRAARQVEVGNASDGTGERLGARWSWGAVRVTRVDPDHHGSIVSERWIDPPRDRGVATLADDGRTGTCGSTC